MKEVCALRSTYICYHFPPGLVPLSVVGPLLFLLQHALPRCAILQGKLAQDFTEAMNADLADRVYRMAEEQQKGMKPADVKSIQYFSVQLLRNTRINFVYVIIH